MPPRKSSKNGMAPDHCTTALLIIDVINLMDFPEAAGMLPVAIEMADRIAALKKRAKAAGVPCIYVNDNFGRWQSDFTKLVKHCLRRETPGRPIVQRLKPEDDDYSVLKPKHSGFYSTSLEVLLEYLGASRLILTGIAGNLCVLYTANDAYMRDYRLCVPEDCTASNSVAENVHALDQMRKALKAEVVPSAEVTFPKQPSRAATGAPGGGKAKRGRKH